MNRILWFTLGSITTLVAGTIITALSEKEEPILVLNIDPEEASSPAGEEYFATKVASEATESGENPNPTTKV